MDHWLIRTSKNWIVGPYSKTHLCQMILEGKLAPQDEICPGNGYWVFLHERGEIKQLLGIEPPRTPRASDLPFSDDDEITETQNLYPEEATDPDLRTFDSIPEQTAMISVKKTPPKKAPTKKTPPPLQSVETKSTPQEPTALWRGLAFVLMVIGILLIYSATHLLKR